jgi:hypothetical protein
MIGSPTLLGTCSHYRVKDGSAEMLVFEYSCPNDNELVACDLVVNTRKGEVYMHDFLRLKDGNWRSAFGDVATVLEALLPSTVLEAVLVSRTDISEFSVRGENV